jgi:two-component system, sensor histidine kinase and response regulator
VQGDPGRVRQVLSNLVGNALKFTKAGEIAVRVRLLRQTAKTVSLRFEINDTGMGIAKDKLAKLFGSFTQVDASTTRRFGGTGLGLAICKRFVELMGGEIGVDSEPDKGSSFWFTLDLLKSPENTFEVPPDRAHLRGLHMLVVEANALNRSAFDQYLTSWGISGSSAPDGRSALKMLSAAQHQGVPYDLVILDFKLPDMDGLELARKIRENPKLGAAKLLLLTSMVKKGDARSAREAGIDGYFTKPIHFSQLEECLALLMGEASTTEDSGTLLTLRTLAELKSQTRLRILVADDNHINQKVVASLLENMGHRAEVVGNGKEAVDAYRSAPYDIVLMDLQMPEMDGFEASHQIHEIAQARGLKTSIVAVTARARKQDREACLARGMDDYVSKPISPMELRAAIDRTMAGAAKGASANNSAPNSVNPEQTVDLVEALASIEGNRDLLREIVHMFIEQYPRLLEQIHQALSSSDGKALAAAAHTLRSSAGQVGAHEALDGARRLEEIGERESLAKAPAVLAKLEEELVRVKSSLLENGYTMPQ